MQLIYKIKWHIIIKYNGYYKKMINSVTDYFPTISDRGIMNKFLKQT